MLHVLAIGSAVALASTLAFGRQSKTLKALRRNGYPQRYLDIEPSIRPQQSLQKSAKPTRRRKARAAPRDIKKTLPAIRKVFLISMGGAQDRDAQFRRLAGQSGDYGVIAADLMLNRRIKIAIGLIGLAAFGAFFYAPLLLIAGAGTLINNLPVFKELAKNLKKGRITTELLEIVSQISFLVTGYFFLATLVCFIALLDLKLLRRTEQNSRNQLIDQFSQKSYSVWVIADGAEVEMPLEAVRKDDIVAVNAGEIIPVDGTVVEGIATIDQHSLTGESQPVEMEKGSRVFATTLLVSGRLLIRAERTGADTNAAKIGQILEQTQDFKEDVRLRGKKIADGFIAPTLFTSSLTLPVFGPSSALAVLWSGFGYDMKLYGPISVLNFLHLMAKNGILIKDGRSLETLQQLDTVVFDKTGTLTIKQPRLGRIYALDAYNEDTLLTYAAAAEFRQTHPAAMAILSAASERGLELPQIEDAAYEVGYGIQVMFKDKLIQVGSIRFMEHKGIHLPAALSGVQNQANDMGSSLIYIAVNERLAGVLRLDPSIRPEAKHIIDYLKAQGITVSIISGDQQEPTRRLAEYLGVDSYYAETLPAQKAELIAKLREDGRHVGYVGDGINDAIALKEANVSISLSGASTVAIDTAQVILMDGDLAKLESLFEISREFEKNMKTNFTLSMVPGVITLSGVFLLHMGVVGALLVYFTSEIIALMNCMSPLIKDEMSGDGDTTTTQDQDNTAEEPASEARNPAVSDSRREPVPENA